ncbi:MAG: hypothetical protein Q8Q12_12790 [bacterium]|nr:hypothetical protein [bacterium]
MEELKAITDNVSRVIDDASKGVREAAESLGAPEVYTLNRRSTLNICAAVAVDTGQTLFGGVLRDVGVALFQVASSQENDDPKSYAFWVDPNLPEDNRKRDIQNRLDELVSKDPVVREFVGSMGWASVYAERVMPPGCYSSAAALADFLRELLEWAKLYDVSRKLAQVRCLGTGIQPVLLRDGTLRFGHAQEGINRPLGELFRQLDLPILGISKQSALLRNPAIILWLWRHGVYAKGGPVMVRIDTDMFRDLGWRLERYFGDQQSRTRFGRYALVRFDPLPGSRNFFAVDIPDFLVDDIDETLVLLSGVAQQSTATSYPTPGYPIALRKVHDKVVFTDDKVYMLENSLRRSIPTEIYEFLKSLGA